MSLLRLVLSTKFVNDVSKVIPKSSTRIQKKLSKVRSRLDRTMEKQVLGKKREGDISRNGSLQAVNETLESQKVIGLFSLSSRANPKIKEDGPGKESSIRGCCNIQ
jgi:hypothetical protein